MKIFKHGGDLSAIRKLYPTAKQPWIDLSTGLNPNSYPWQTIVPPNELLAVSHKLPQKNDIDECVIAWTKYLAAKNCDEWLLTAGSQAFINIMPRVFSKHTCVIATPSYNEYERSWSIAGRTHKLIERDKISANLSTPNTILILTNPNNPDGYIWDKKTLFDIASSLAENDGILVVDEAFADLNPEISLASDTLPENIILLRSFGKFFGLGGLRLGIVRLTEEVKLTTELEIGPWSVNSIAILIAKYATLDSNWISDAKTKLTVDAKRLADILTSNGFNLLGRTDLFQLVEHKDFLHITKKLNQNGIYVRTFEESDNIMRFGIPKNDQEFMRLKETLS